MTCVAGAKLRHVTTVGQPLGGAEVSVRHVRKTYDGRVHALVDVSLDLAAGELLLLTGPSGCGKSTLLNLIGGLDTPDAGEILVDRQSLPELTDAARFRRETIGFVFQHHLLIPGLTARENVEIPLIPTGTARAQRTGRALELLAEVGLEARADHLPAQLSGGERQRVAIARALVNDPRLLLADEPTGSLDSVSSGHVLGLLEEIRARRGMTVLLVSYDPAVDAHADRRVRMRDGRVVTDEVLSAGG